MSDGTTRYFFVSEDNKECYFVFTDEMKVLSAVRTYTVTYDANGGSGAPAQQTFTEGSAIALSEIIPTRSGYTFICWSTSPSPADALHPGQSYYFNEDMRLYALWLGTATVEYDANGGTGAPDSHSAKMNIWGNIIFTVSQTIPERSGYTFDGWRMDQNDVEWIYVPGETVSFRSGSTKSTTVRLYAQWKGIEPETSNPGINVLEYYRPTMYVCGNTTIHMTLKHDNRYSATKYGYIVTDKSGSVVCHEEFVDLPVSGEHQYELTNVPYGQYCVYGYVVINGRAHRSYPVYVNLNP